MISETVIRGRGALATAFAAILLAMAAVAEAQDAAEPAGVVAKTRIYFAGALFSARETYFNVVMAEKLEKAGYSVILPQRDGFQFLRLMLALDKRLPSEDVLPAVQDIIYYLDVGHFIPSCDVILANLDEPVDEGVVVEISYAKLMGKIVIGIRTDIRSPYGESKSPYGGMHFFPAYQCDKVLSFFFAGKSAEQENLQLDNMVKSVDGAVVSLLERRNGAPMPALPEHIVRIQDGAKLLFEGVREINGDGLDVVAGRYKEHKEKLRIKPETK